MPPVSLNVMQFNIEYGGTGVEFGSVAKAISVAKADVVAIQEGCGSMRRLAVDLGWKYYDVRTQVVSRFPLWHPEHPVAGAIYVEVEPGHVIAVINVHPASRRFGPTRIAKGYPVEKVLKNERGIRLTELQPSLEVARELMDVGVPVVLLGDFNAPSHRDWTEHTIGMRSHLLVPVDWPTSVACEEIGLTDVYRAVYADPITHPGITWPADRPFVKGYNPARRGAPADRIDLMFASDKLTIDKIQIMGEKQSPFSELFVDPWPTDHRALVAQFEVEPAQLPTLVSTLQRVQEVGSSLEVRYNAVDGDAARVALVPTEANAGDLIEVEVPDAERGVVELVTSDAGAGMHQLTLTNANGRELASLTVWLLVPGAKPIIRTNHHRYDSGESIVVNWDRAPGNRADWICVFARDADPATAQRVLYLYTEATVTGQADLRDAIPHQRWPLAPGNYTVHLLLDDLQQSLAQSDFKVI